ncbi:MAG: GNAT family N-acetyltransferase [Caldilinea sp.]
MHLTIRPAVAADFDLLCVLYHAFHDYHADRLSAYLRTLEPFEDRDCKALYGSLEQIVANEDSVILVAQIEDFLVGMAEVYVRHIAPLTEAVVPHCFGYLQTLMVVEGRRRCGIGSALLLAAQDWAKARGAREMQLEMWEMVDGPLGFYEHLGYLTLKRTLTATLI